MVSSQSKSLWDLRGQQQLFICVSSCTGPNCERGVLDYNAGWGLYVWGAHRELQYLLVCLQVSVSAEAYALEEYKHSASVQSLLLLLKTGYGSNTGTESKSMWGANTHSVVGLHQVKRMHNYSFCHCLYEQRANSLYAGSYSLEHLNTQLRRELHVKEHVDTIVETG